MTYLDEVRDALRGWDAGRERSEQTEPGWSEVGGCRRALAYGMSGTWATDEPDTWRALVGTLLHEGMAEVLAKALTGLQAFEVVTSYALIPGHSDHVQIDRNRVVDWKFPTVAVAEAWRRDAEAFLQKRRQVHGYAAGLVEAGRLTEDCTVSVLVMPVDGSFDDWWEFTEPFDRSIADEAAERVAYVRELMESGDPVPRDKPYGWCEQFCEFFLTCRGEQQAADDAPLVDPELVALVNRYGEIKETAGPLEKERKRIAAEIKGIRGVTPTGWRVAMTRPAGTKEVPDEAQIAADYEASGLDLPTRTVATSTPSLYVSRAKSPKEKP